MAKLGYIHTVLQHVSHPLGMQHEEDVLPQHNWPAKPLQPSGAEEVDGQMFTRSFYHHNQMYEDDKDTYQATYLARELRVDKLGWEHFTKGRCGLPHPFIVSIFHIIRNIIHPPPGGVSYENVEAELYEVKQQKVKAARRCKRESERRCRFRAIHPLSRFALAYACFVTFVDATYTAFIVPIGIAWQFNAKSFSWYNAVDIAAGVVYWVDILMGFLTGFVAIYNLRRKVIREPRLVAEYYLWHSTFFPDLVAALPLIAEVVCLAIPGQGGGLTLHIILLLRLARMWHVVKFAEKMVFMSMIGRLNRTITRYFSIGHIFFINVTYAACVFINLLGCIWYYVATLEGLENSWLTSVENKNIVHASAPRQWVASVYFVTLTITTVGYGDLTPVSAAEEIIAMGFMLIGVIFFGFVISSSQRLVTYLSSEARKAGMLRSKLEQVELWTQRRHMSPVLTRRIRAYYAEVWLQYAEINDETFFRELPAALRTDMAMELARPIFSSSKVFECLDEDAERLIAARVQPMIVLAGHDVAQEGDEADALYLLQEGEVLLLRHTRDVRLITAPAIVGESVLLNLLPDEGPNLRPVTVRAVSPCLIWTLSVKDLEHIFQMLPGVRQKMAEMARRRMQRYLRHSGKDERQHWEHMLDRASQLENHISSLEEEQEETEEEKEEEAEEELEADAEPVHTQGSSSEEEDAEGQEMSVRRGLEDVPRELQPLEIEDGVRGGGRGCEAGPGEGKRGARNRRRQRSQQLRRSAPPTPPANRNGRSSSSKGDRALKKASGRQGSETEGESEWS